MTQNWRHHAACRPGSGVDPELFFPVSAEHTESGREAVAAAKRVCASCPVMAQCRAWSFATGQTDGVSGGLSADERRAATRRMASTRVAV